MRSNEYVIFIFLMMSISWLYAVHMLKLRHLQMLSVLRWICSSKWYREKLMCSSSSNEIMIQSVSLAYILHMQEICRSSSKHQCILLCISESWNSKNIHLNVYSNVSNFRRHWWIFNAFFSYFWKRERNSNYHCKHMQETSIW